MHVIWLCFGKGDDTKEIYDETFKHTFIITVLGSRDKDTPGRFFQASRRYKPLRYTLDKVYFH